MNHYLSTSTTLNREGSTFASGLFIAAIALLLCNDLVLKSAYPGFITGKLSDIAGLFALPLFLSSFFPKQRLPIYVGTAVCFILWKMPVANDLISAVNTFLPYRIGRTIDYGDLWTLLILPLSFYHRPQRGTLGHNKGVRIVVGIVACIAFCATAGTHGRIKVYHFRTSKYELQSAIDCMFEQYPEMDLRKGDSLYEAGSDPYFRCYLVDDYGPEVFHVRYYESEEYWNTHPAYSAIFIVSVAPYGGGAKIDDELSSEERMRVITKFEKGFIARLAQYVHLLPAEDGDFEE